MLTVVTDFNEEKEYFRLADAAQRSPLIGYMQEAECTPAADGNTATDIDCIWRIPRDVRPVSSNASSHVTNRRLHATSNDEAQMFSRVPRPGEPQLIYRFSPGKCTFDDAEAYMNAGTGYNLQGNDDTSAASRSQVDENGVPFIFPAPVVTRQLGCCEEGNAKLDITMAYYEITGGW